MAEPLLLRPAAGGKLQRIQSVELPASIAEELARFLLDKATGNVQLNIKDGMILGARMERLIKA